MTRTLFQRAFGFNPDREARAAISVPAKPEVVSEAVKVLREAGIDAEPLMVRDQEAAR